MRHGVGKPSYNRCKLLLLCSTLIGILLYCLLFALESGSLSPSASLSTNKLSISDSNQQQTLQPIDIDARSAELTSLRRAANLSMCDYLAVKGLAHSGTNWLKHILRTLRNRICAHPNLAHSAPLCIVNANHPRRVGDWNKFAKTDIADRVDVNSQRNAEYLRIRREMVKAPETRFCHVAVIRDPRSALLSEIFWFNYKNAFRFPDSPNHSSSARHRVEAEGLRFESAETGVEVDAETVNEAVLSKFGERVFALNQWWHFYRAIERRSPGAYFVCFFDDLLLRPLRTLEDMLVFVEGFPRVLTPSDVAAVVEETRFERTLADGVWAMQRKGKVCDFASAENKLTREALEFMDANVMRHLLVPELLRKFNRSCPITSRADYEDSVS